MKKSQESEIFTLKERLSEFESDIISKSAELSQAALDKQEALSPTLMEIAHLKEENARKVYGQYLILKLPDLECSC